MVKVRFGKAEYEALKKFEKIHHPDIWKWIVDKVTGGETSEKQVKILDVSDEPSIFALMLAEQFPQCSITCAIRSGEIPPQIELPSNVTIFNYNTHDDLKSAGKFDVVILKELTQEVGDLGELLGKIRETFGDNGGKVILMTRPKNPPLPLPEVCLPLWRKLAFSREEVTAAANKTEMQCVCFSASVPCTVPKFDWEAILFSGCFPVVKSASKCTADVITNFCKARPPKIAFEEKISMFLLSTTSPGQPQ